MKRFEMLHFSSCFHVTFRFLAPVRKRVYIIHDLAVCWPASQPQRAQAVRVAADPTSSDARLAQDGQVEGRYCCCCCRRSTAHVLCIGVQIPDLSILTLGNFGAMYTSVQESFSPAALHHFGRRGDTRPTVAL